MSTSDTKGLYQMNLRMLGDGSIYIDYVDGDGARSGSFRDWGAFSKWLLTELVKPDDSEKWVIRKK